MHRMKGQACTTCKHRPFFNRSTRLIRLTVAGAGKPNQSVWLGQFMYTATSQHRLNTDFSFFFSLSKSSSGNADGATLSLAQSVRFEMEYAGTTPVDFSGSIAIEIHCVPYNHYHPASPSRYILFSPHPQSLVYTRNCNSVHKTNRATYALRAYYIK
ncbi:hypothetical protein BaRGS_00016402, partial [Batillaria attramentaria]